MVSMLALRGVCVCVVVDVSVVVGGVGQGCGTWVAGQWVRACSRQAVRTVEHRPPPQTYTQPIVHYKSKAKIPASHGPEQIINGEIEEGDDVEARGADGIGVGVVAAHFVWWLCVAGSEGMRELVSSPGTHASWLALTPSLPHAQPP